jgi:hypothetical protein
VDENVALLLIDYDADPWLSACPSVTRDWDRNDGTDIEKRLPFSSGVGPVFSHVSGFHFLLPEVRGPVEIGRGSRLLQRKR